MASPLTSTSTRPIRREAGDQFLHVLLLADHTRDRLGLAHAERLDLVLRHALADQVVAHGVRTALGQLLVVLLRTDRIGVTRHQHQLELLHLRELGDDFGVDRGLAFGLQDGLVEVEQRLRRERDLLHAAERAAAAAASASAAAVGGGVMAGGGAGGFGTRSGSHWMVAIAGVQ